MSNNKKKKNKKYAEINSNSGSNTIKWPLVRIAPLLVAIAIVPILVGPYLDQLDPMTAKFWINSQYVAFYDHHSALAMIILLSAMIAIFFLTFKADEIPKNTSKRLVIYGLVIFAAFTLISTIFACNKDLALWGAPDRYEGLFVHLSYIACALYAMIILNGSDNKRTVENAIILLAAVISVLGTAQMLGKNLLFTEPLNSFINLFSNASVKVAEGSSDPSMSMSITFGNSNYVGSYAALIIPMLFVIAVDKSSKNLRRGVALVLLICSIVILFASKSQAGLVGIIAGLTLYLIANIKFLALHKKQALISVLSLVVGMAATFAFLPNEKKWLISNLFQEAKEFVIPISKEEHEFDPNYGLSMYGFEIKGNKMKISTVNGELSLYANGAEPLRFFDSNNIGIAAQYNQEQGAYILSPPFENITYKYAEGESNELQGIQLSYAGSNFILLENNFNEGLYLVDERFNRIEFVHAPYFGFEGKEKLGSGRGYIWSRSIPLLKNTLIKGYGPDNFLVVFPQHDYWAKTYVYNNSYMITDKPHNMYLQWGINNGVIGTLALLIAFGIYIANVSRELFKYNQEDPNRFFKLGILCAVVGYLATGMFNDSITSIAPIFWSLFGIGVSMMEDKETIIKEQ